MAIHQGGEPLLEFRLAYLRAIARSWDDPAYQEELLAQKDIQPILHRDFGLNTWWPNLDIVLNRSADPAEQTEWKPELTAGWIGMDDGFSVVLPQAPKAKATEALAAYYQMFPDFMGSVTTFDDGATSVLRGALPTSLGIPSGGTDSLLAFGGVVLRAVTLAWQSPEFLKQLTRSGETDTDAAPVLSQWLGYNNPFNFQVRFETEQAFTWDAARGEWNLQRADGTAIKNGIVLNYPVAPAEQDLWAIALTSYNNTGDAYPFTC